MRAAGSGRNKLEWSSVAALPRRPCVAVEATGPGFHVRMVDEAAGINVCQAFQRQAVPLFFLDYPGIERLLHDRVSGTLQPLRQAIEPLGEGKR